MHRFLVPLAILLTVFSVLGADRPRPREESMSSDRFAEAHAPLFQKRDNSDPAELTERIAKSLPRASGATSLAGVTPRNFVDHFIFGKIALDGVPHAPSSNDGEFLRRVTLDLTGRIPEPTEIRVFLADPNPHKRDQLIDGLLESEAYVHKWAYFFMDLFRANGKMGRGQNLFHYWMKENLRADRPYDDVARAIVAASAKSNHVVAAANVIAREHVQGQPQPKDGDDFGMVQQLDTDDELAILYAKTFLGVNLSCISCHDGGGHLEKVNVWLSRKTREEFFQYASFLGRSRYLMYWEDGKPQSGEFLIDDQNPGYDTEGPSMIRVPRTGGPKDSAFILTGAKPKAGAEPREELGRLLTAHPQFARAAVNLFWWRLMSRGIVEPYDEFDLARQDPRQLPKGWDLQPSHPELLEALASDFRKSRYSVKHLLRTICRSNAYQLSARFDGDWKERFGTYFARKFVRLLTAEELHDAIAVATGRPASFKFGNNQVGMAMQLSGPAGSGDIRHFMQTFGQSNRNNPPRLAVGSPLQPLLLMQSPVVMDRVKAEKDGKLGRLLDQESDDSRVIEELFLSTLGRPPLDDERQVALAALSSGRVQGAQNLQWALINMTEFFFNY